MSESLNDVTRDFRSLRYRSDFTTAAKLRRFAWEVVWLKKGCMKLALTSERSSLPAIDQIWLPRKPTVF